MSRRGAAGAIASLTLACVFGVTMMLSLITGAGVYQRVQDRVDHSAADRIGLTYITARIHSADTAGAVEAGTFGSGDAIFVTEDMGGVPYETILYVYDGWLREMLCEKGWEPGPEAGQAITEAGGLVVEETRPGLFHLEYQDSFGQLQTADVYLRSEG